MVGRAFNYQLFRPGRQAHIVVQHEVVRNEGLKTGQEQDAAPTRAAAIWTIIAVDRESVALLVDLRRGETSQVRDLYAGIQQGPDDELLPHLLAGRGHAGRFLGQLRLAFELVWHSTSETGANRHHFPTETRSTCDQVWAAGFRPGTHALTRARLLPPLVPRLCGHLA
jgi:hypothetical protein